MCIMYICSTIPINPVPVCGGPRTLSDIDWTHCTNFVIVTLSVLAAHILFIYISHIHM